VELALLRSCNGYFLDWAAAEPKVSYLGRFGPVLLALGLQRLPESVSEAIGLEPTLGLSPWALAQAYRVLAEAQPKLIELLGRNHQSGTLSGLSASAALAGFATKTGTVRGPGSQPRLGLVVAVSADLVVVKTVAERAPRSFVDELARDLRELAALGGQGAATVQTFALLPPWQVEAECGGLPVVDGEPVAPRGFAPLMHWIQRGSVLCLGAPWQIRFPDLDGPPRPYAGVFSLSPAPPLAEDNGATPKQNRARRGSDILFRTSLGRYTAGVLAAEDAGIAGAARIALGRVVAHNVAHSRHGSRPVCDTTHCQVFPGTVPLPPGDDLIFAAGPLPTSGWLHFSRGGDEPWQRQVGRAEVEGLLGANPTGLRVRDGRIAYQRTVATTAATWDETVELPCDLVRQRLRLPACPDAIAADGPGFTFAGRGQGHGQGLDVEWAKKSGLDAPAILRAAYGFE
jgi:hypothetical protein